MPISASRRTILPPLNPNGLSSEHYLKSKSDPNISHIKVQKNVLITVENIERDILNFGDRLMRKQRSSLSDVLKFLTFLEKQLDIEKIIDANHLLSILENNSQRTNLLGPEFYDLENICDKLLRIDYMFQDVPVKIDYVFNRNLLPFCVSLVEEVGNKEVPPITKEYEEIIVEYRKKITDITEQIDKISFNHEKPLSIRDYINNHDKINKITLNWGELNLELCSIAKSWIDIDRLYPDKLRDTVFWLRNRRHNVTSKIHHLKKSIIKSESDRIKVEGFMKKSQGQTTQAQTDVSHYIQRERNAVVARRKMENNIAELERMLDFHINERAKCSDSKKAAFHNDQIQIHESSLEQAQKRLQRLHIISNQFSQEQHNSSQSIDYSKGTLNQQKEDLDRIVMDITTTQQSIDELIDKINAIEDQIIVVQRIRSMKLDDSAFRLMNSRNYQPGTPKSYNDQTDDFFKLSAAVIGKLWKQVYKRLPFDPPRDWKQIEMDLEAVDINNRRLELDFVMLSYLSLQKWRRLSNQANINNLVKVLKKMNLAKYVLPLNSKSAATEFS